MKTIGKIATLLFLTLLTISCSSNDEIPSTKIKKEEISSKWEIENSNYKSFEFNKDGNYIIVKSASANKSKSQKNEKNILLGQYEIVDDKTINLIDFGQIIISSINGTKMDFTIVDNKTSTSIEVSSSKIEKISSSSNTDLLCRTWKMTEVNGEDVVGTINELTVIFSQAGTYFVELANPTSENEGGLAEWKWEDAKENKFCYSWEGEANCTGDNSVSIAEIKENLLVLMEGKETFKLEPISNSVPKSTKKPTKTVNLKKGVFSKF
ncbi:hypothetical protein F7018_11460 [Tenacibaculum aiptasiae]|uniref:Lipocalin family protein n=1 Tax=Tenacibaculum aiptasiae TaxID=426481 RepID=A0A7J5AG00_9FLAO|nr:hypothetical protein [Tenacibaculum aiptasiae]KAB1155919.1 hypothetical protein F7018_11460 [Tenacibaculum aiptasiae]